MSRRKKRRTTFGDIMSTLLMLIALVVFIFSGYTLYGFYKEYQKGSNEYDNLESSYASDEGESEDLDALEDEAALQDISGREVANIIWDGKELTVPTMKNPIDFSELQQVNEDIAGWLRIRALDISYPVVQGEDNDYYLHRTFEKEDNFAGCLFVNCDNDRDFTDQNTIIYGHNMKSGMMFGELKKYLDEDFYNAHKTIEFNTLYERGVYEIIEVGLSEVQYQDENVFRYYNFLNADSEEEYQEYLNNVAQLSVYGTEIDSTYGDQLLTLSTCNNYTQDGRMFILAKRVQ